jgi:uncharacterized protein YkwD
MDGARGWSSEMSRTGFRHDDLSIPQGCRGAGENIASYPASATVVQDMFEGWMDSQGHRENILRPQFTHIGVGMFVAGRQAFGTQRFATC